MFRDVDVYCSEILCEAVADEDAAEVEEEPEAFICNLKRKKDLEIKLFQKGGE